VHISSQQGPVFTPGSGWHIKSKGEKGRQRKVFRRSPPPPIEEIETVAKNLGL